MLAFVHISKTSGTTIKQIMRQSFGPQHCDVQPWVSQRKALTPKDMLRLKRVYPRLASIHFHYVDPYYELEEVWPDIQYFTFLRDPIVRCASQYQEAHRIHKTSVARDSFEEWIGQRRHQNRQIRELLGGLLKDETGSKADNSADYVDTAISLLEEKFQFVGLAERFDESMVMLKKTVDEPRLRIRYKNYRTAPSNEVKNQILNDPGTRAMLEEANQADLKLYEYVKQNIYPRQEREYGDGLESDVSSMQQANHPSMFNQYFSPGYLSGALKRIVYYGPALMSYRSYCRVTGK